MSRSRLHPYHEDLPTEHLPAGSSVLRMTIGLLVMILSPGAWLISIGFVSLLMRVWVDSDLSLRWPLVFLYLCFGSLTLFGLYLLLIGPGSYRLQQDTDFQNTRRGLFPSVLIGFIGPLVLLMFDAFLLLDEKRLVLRFIQMFWLLDLSAVCLLMSIYFWKIKHALATRTLINVIVAGFTLLSVLLLTTMFAVPLMDEENKAVEFVRSVSVYMAIISSVLVICLFFMMCHLFKLWRAVEQIHEQIALRNQGEWCE